MERDGRMSARYHYDEFGIPLDRKKFDINWPGPDNLNGYTGLEYDYYTDLTYARARYYKAEIGRFISEDAYKGDLWNPQSQNLYVYVWNNPLLFVDPTGNWPSWSDIWNGGKEVADFLLLDDIRTLADPNASWGDKAWALAGFIPIGKFIKGGKIIAKTGEEVLEESNKIIKSVKKEKGNNYSNYFDKNSATKGMGKITGSLNGLTDAEKKVVGDLTASGKNVEIIPKDPNAINKTPDFRVDGVKTELKTLQNPNTNTGMKRIQEGFGQGAETVIIDARGSGLTSSQAKEIINRASGKFENKQLPGKVEIWTDEGNMTYP